ncbi:formylglycine-generating enzyme family protein [Thiosocius teredinicola]|uniref:formylglycine-generating enzyme family protein n=1 Tax=Thiosocius teredinicola TaxID=1973002 RepID=UPI0013DDA7CC
MPLARLLLLFVVGLPALVHAAPEVFENALGMRFSVLPAATFQMGTADLDDARFDHPEPDKADISDESPAHRVTLSAETRMGQTEVTQAQWLAVMQNRPGPAEHWQGDTWRDLPVVGVSWTMAQRFAEELSAIDPEHDYRLPTEAEWEYAARAGSTDLRPVPLQTLESHAWYIHNSGDVPHPVATRQPNAFGLYDMLGNAWEWVGDRYARDSYRRRAQGEETAVDPAGPAKGELRIRRGGSYHCPQHLVRPGYRTADPPGKRYSVLGFRVVAVPQSG